MPVDHFGVARNQPGRRRVLAQRAFVVFQLHGDIARIHVVVGPLQGDQAAQFAERLRVIVHAQVEQPVHPRLAGGLGAHHHERGRLLAANVAAHGLGGIQRGEHPVRQIALGLRERLGHRGPNLIVEHHVRLHAELRAQRVARGVDAARAGVGGHFARSIDHRHLPHLASVVGSEQPAQRLRRGFARAQQFEPELAVGRVRERLARDGAHAGLGPDHVRPHREPVRLDRRAQFTGHRIPRDDRKRVHRAHLRLRDQNPQHGNGKSHADDGIVKTQAREGRLHPRKSSSPS